MSWAPTPLAVPLFVGAAVMAFVAVLAWRRDSGHGTLALLWLAAAVCVYDLGYAFELGAHDVRAVRFWLKVQYLGVTSVPPLVFLLAAAYTGRRRLLAPLGCALLFALPVVTCVLAFTNEAHELIWRGLRIERDSGFTRTFFEPGTWYRLHNVYAQLLFVGTLVLLVRTLASAHSLFRRQLLALLAGVLIPAVLHVVYLSSSLFAGLDPNPYALVVSGCILAWALLELRLWDVVPVAREAVLASMREAVFVVDRHGRLADVNPAAQELLLVPPARALGQPVEDVFPAWRALSTVFPEGDVLRTELSLDVRGAARHFAVALSPLTASSGRSEGLVAVLHDATERHEVERLRESLTRTMVHDLKNPLTVIHGALEVIEACAADTLPEAARGVLESARQSSRRLVELVGAILDLRSLETRRMPLDLRRHDVAELLGEALKLQASLAEVKRQRLTLDGAPDLPPVQVDRRLVGRVLQNLLSNAIKFTPPGGTIRVNASVQGRQLELRVTDDGPGIPRDLRERLFREFVTGSLDGRGHGLGLAFCRLAIEAHGGRIWVESEPGLGAMFAFTLPLADA